MQTKLTRLILLTIFASYPLIVAKSQESERKQVYTRDDLIETSSELKELADCFHFAEGPTSDKKGNIFFTDILSSRIYSWSVDNNLSVFRDPSGRANGLKFDSNDNLLACEGALRRITSTSEDGEIRILTDQYQGKKLNSPNDLWIDPKGGIYFTDPRYSNAKWIWVEKGDSDNSGFDSLYKEEQESRAVYYLPPNSQSLKRVAEDFINPNGVIGTLDGKKLYISDTEKKEVYLFDILEDGSLINRQLFIKEYSDGMTLDEFNNLYLTNGDIQIYTPEGNLLTTIVLPNKSSNVCFGGKEHKTLFITAREKLYCIDMNVTGQ